MSIRLDEFLDEIEQAKSEKQIAKICEAQLQYYRDNHEFTTWRGYVSDCRNALRELNPDHPALKYLKLSREEHNKYKENYTKKVDIKSSNLVFLSGFEFTEISQKLVNDYFAGKHGSLTKLALGVAGLTGRRFFSEIWISGRFEYVDEITILFSGQAKTKEDLVKREENKKINSQVKPYKIPVLSDANLIISAIKEIRNQKPVNSNNPEIVKATSLSYTITADEHCELMAKYHDELKIIMDKSKNARSKESSAAVKKIFGDKIPGIMVKDLRNIYAETCYTVFDIRNTLKMDRNSYFSRILGHSQHDTYTAQAYKSFAVND